MLKLLKSIKIFQSYDHKCTATFLWFTVYTHNALYSSSLYIHHDIATMISYSFYSKWQFIANKDQESNNRTYRYHFTCEACRANEWQHDNTVN